MNPCEVLELAESVERAEQAPRSGRAPLPDLSTVAPEIAPAVEYLAEHDRAAAMRLVGALSTYWQDAGLLDEGRRLTDLALADGHRLAAGDDAIARAIPRALVAASELSFRQGDQEQASDRAHAAIRAAVLVEDYGTAAMAHVNLARVAYRDGDAERIEQHARKALEWAGNDALARRGALHMLAWAAHTAGDLDEAERRFEESLAYRRRAAGPRSVAVEIANLADLALERGDLARAARLNIEALDLFDVAESAYMLAHGLWSIAALAFRAELLDDAARLIGAADAVADTAGLTPDPGLGLEAERAELASRLGVQRYSELVGDGAPLAGDEAVALARDVAHRLAG